MPALHGRQLVSVHDNASALFEALDERVEFRRPARARPGTVRFVRRGGEQPPRIASARHGLSSDRAARRRSGEPDVEPSLHDRGFHRDGMRAVAFGRACAAEIAGRTIRGSCRGN